MPGRAGRGGGGGGGRTGRGARCFPAAAMADETPRKGNFSALVGHTNGLTKPASLAAAAVTSKPGGSGGSKKLVIKNFRGGYRERPRDGRPSGPRRRGQLQGGAWGPRMELGGRPREKQREGWRCWAERPQSTSGGGGCGGCGPLDPRLFGSLLPSWRSLVPVLDSQSRVGVPGLPR